MRTTDLTDTAWRDHDDRDVHQLLIADGLAAELAADVDPATW